MVQVVESVINGEAVTSNGDAQELINPTTGEVMAISPAATQSDVDAAYKSAAAGFAVGETPHQVNDKKHY